MNYTKLQEDLTQILGVSIYRIEKQLKSNVIEMPVAEDYDEFKKRYQGRTDLKPYEVELNIFKMTVDGLVSVMLAAVHKNNSHCIELTPAEIQSGLTRVQWAEGLIKQLPADHDGRNSWLLNYGTKEGEPC